MVHSQYMSIHHRKTSTSFNGVNYAALNQSDGIEMFSFRYGADGCYGVSTIRVFIHVYSHMVNTRFHSMLTFMLSRQLYFKRKWMRQMLKLLMLPSDIYVANSIILIKLLCQHLDF